MRARPSRPRCPFHGGKVCYETYKEAEKGQRGMRRNQHETVDIFQCESTNSYHLGHDHRQKPRPERRARVVVRAAVWRETYEEGDDE